MSEENAGLYALRAPAVGTFPNLLEAKAVQVKGKPSGEPKYSLNVEFEADHVDLKDIKAKALAVAAAKWPGRNFGQEAATTYKDEKGNLVPKQPTFIFPFTSGDKLADNAKKNGKDREFSRGKAVLTARSKFEPGLSVIENGRLVEYEGDKRPTAKSKFYNGVLVLVEVNFQAYDGVGQNPDGVTAYLNKVVSLNKGTKLSGGGTSAAEVFKGYIGTTSAEDPTAGQDLDDEIPF